eukprot:scaffold94598_cov18-Tisochrysis_lutea.AAC.3
MSDADSHFSYSFSVAPKHCVPPASCMQVCQRLASLLPKRLCISPLSPLCSASTPPKDGISL